MVAAEMRTVDVQGWPVAFLAGDNEPRVRDLDLAERLGYERPRKIRDLIERMKIAGKLNDIHVCPTVGRTSMPNGGTRETLTDEYFLTESQALKVAAKSETEPADALLDEMIAVYVAARKNSMASELHLSLLARSNAALTQGDANTARILVRALDELLSGERLASPVAAPKLSASRDGRGRAHPPDGTHPLRIVAAMSTADFRAARDAIGTLAQMAAVAGRCSGTVGFYLNGRVSVPRDVADRVRAHLLTLGSPVPAPTGGRPKTVAAMTTEEFMAAVQRVGGVEQMVAIVNRAKTTIYKYAYGDCGVPAEVAAMVRDHVEAQNAAI